MTRWQYGLETSLTFILPANHSAVLDLGDGVAGKHGRVGKIGLLQLDQAAECDQGVRDGLLDLVLAVLAADVPPGDLGVADDGRQHGKELACQRRRGAGAGDAQTIGVTFPRMRPPAGRMAIGVNEGYAAGGRGAQEAKEAGIERESRLSDS